MLNSLHVHNADVAGLILMIMFVLFAACKIGRLFGTSPPNDRDCVLCTVTLLKICRVFKPCARLKFRASARIHFRSAALLPVQTAKYTMMLCFKQDRYTYFVNAFVNNTRIALQRLVLNETSRIQVCIQTVTNQNFINNCAINRNVVVSPTISCGNVQIIFSDNDRMVVQSFADG